MPAPKSKKPADANGSAQPKSAAVPLAPSESKDTSSDVATLPGGRPDKAAYDAEQNRVKAEIESLQTKLSAVREKISLATSKSGPGNEKRNALKAELDSIRSQQSTGKNSRSSLLDQKKVLQESVEAKKKALKAAKAKIPFKTVAEAEAHIKTVEKQVESGSLKLAEEKRALQDISNTKRHIRQLEGLRNDEASVEEEEEKIQALKQQLDDPEAQKLSARYDEVRAELETLKQEGDEAFASRSKLFSERDGLQAQINELYDRKRKLQQDFKEAGDKYWAKVHEDRARRQERAKAQRDAEILAKRLQKARELREEAETPAFQAEIEDCQTLIDYFSGKSDSVTYKTSAAKSLSTKAELAGVPKLDIRKVEEAPEGLVALKKKGNEEENYFVASKRGKKNQGANKKAPAAPAAAPEASPAPATGGGLNITLATLAALGELSIPAPESQADVPRLIADLTTKKNWYEANQARVTAERIAAAEAKIRDLANQDTSDGSRTPIETTATPSEAADEKVEA